MAKYIKGMFQDTPEVDQPQSTWRYAKNALVNKVAGGITNEGGIERLVTLSGAVMKNIERVIGKIEVSDNRAIIFTATDVVDYTFTNPVDGSITEYTGVVSGIYQLTGDELKLVLITRPSEYIPLLEDFNVDFDLKFSLNYPIEGTFKINSEKELLIYWTDNLNYPRSLNVTRQLSFEDIDDPNNPPTHALRVYGRDPELSTNKNYIDRLNLFPHSGPVPTTSFNAIHASGGLETGIYYLALAYVDTDHTYTNYLTVSMPVSIVDEPEDTIPGHRIDGAPAGTVTGKSITWDINNLNNDYDFIRPVIISIKGGAETAVTLKDQEITTSNMQVTYTGMEGYTPAALAEVIIDTVNYDTAKTIGQLDDVLYLGNLSSNKDVGYQKYANNMGLIPVTKVIENFDPYEISEDNLLNGYSVESTPFPDNEGNTNTALAGANNGYRSPDYNVKYRGYTRDEVYAIYIAFIMNDGSMSYAYHVPGRAAIHDELTQIQNTPIGVDPCSGGALIDTVNQRSTQDSELYSISGGTGRKFHFYDYSAEDDAWGMNFWRNENERYPNTEDFDTWNYNGLMGESASLRGKRVRHHHFPSNENIAYRFLNGVQTGTEITESQVGMGGLFSASFRKVGYTEDNFIGSGQWEHRFFFDVDEDGTPSTTGPWASDPTNGEWTLNDDAVMPVDGQCVYCRSKNTSYQESYSTCSGGWFFGRASYTGGGLSIITGTDTSSIGSDCPCNYDWRAGIDSFGDQQFNNRDDNDEICNQSTTCYDPSDYDSGDAPQRGCHNGYRTNTWDGNIDTAMRGTCYWKNNNAVETVTGGGEYITRPVSILGFHLMNMYIPDDIKKKTQGFRIYYAKRAHHNRRILGQDISLPMRHVRKAISFCDMDFIDKKDVRWLRKLDEAKDIRNLMAGEGDDNEGNQLAKPLWFKDPFIRQQSVYVEDEYNICAYDVFSFHDFYMLNSHNSVAHATHFKPEYIVDLASFKGIGLKKVWNMFVDGDQLQQFPFPDDGSDCQRRGIVNSFFIGTNYNGTEHPLLQLSLQGVLNRPIKEKCKTYLRGDSLFNAKPLGFGYDINNEHGESCLAFQVVKDRGLPPLDVTTGKNVGNANSNVDGYVGTSSFTNDKWPISLGEKAKAYQGNLHAFKLDMYNSLDTNTLVWTGYEIIGDDYINFGTGLGDSTINVHPEGIFGGDTIISRHGYRSTVRPKWMDIGNADPATGDKPGRDLRAAYMTICESTDNINFRHMGEKAQGQDTYIPGAPIQDILNLDNNQDLTFNMGDNTTNNMRYNEDYSRLNDIRVPFPLPAKEIAPDKFPTRVHRTQRNDPNSLIDNYRIALANQYRDLPKDKGVLQSISGIGNLLYLHMTDTLFKTVGKETLELGASVNAYIGTGDIFDRNPVEVSQTYYGYGGTSSQFANLVTSLGYFWVDQSSRKVFMLGGEQPLEISAGGMKQWFKKNIPYELESYGMSDPSNYDNPFTGMGFTSTWDSKNERILLTKKDLIPTKWFKRARAAYDEGFYSYRIRWNEQIGKFQYEYYDGGSQWIDIDITLTSTIEDVYPTYAGQVTAFGYPLGNYIEWRDENMTEEDCLADAGVWIDDNNVTIPTCRREITKSEDLFEEKGWTISFYPELGIWVSFHDYTPSVYILTGDRLLSAKSDSNIIYKHDTIWYGDLYDDGTHRSKADFVFEFIHNENNLESKKFYNFHYNADVWEVVSDDLGGQGGHRHVKIHNSGFTSFYVYTTFQNSGETDITYMDNIRNTSNDWKINRFRDISFREQVDDVNNFYGTSPPATTSETQPMFIYDGMDKTINPDFLDPNGVGTQGKFTDKFIGICLKYNNNTNNLVSLYSTQIGMRKYFR